MSSYIFFISNILQNVGSDVIIRNDSSFHYLSREELQNQDIQNILKNLTNPGIQTVATGVEIAFKEWNERVAPLLPPDNSNKFIKLIKDMSQNVYDMSQESLDSFKSLFKMDTHCGLSVSDNKSIEVFYSTDPNQSWQCEAVQKFKQLKHLIEQGPNVHVQAFLVTASLLLVSWSIYDLCKVFNECEIIENLMEKDKMEYVNDLELLELSLDLIIKKLENLSNNREEIKSMAVYESQLPILYACTKRIIDRIKAFDDKIQKDIEVLSIRESRRRTISVASAMFSAASVGMTYWNWNNWNAPQRATGVFVSGATGVTAILTHLSANQLQKLQKTLKQTLTDLKSLNEQLERINSAESYHRESIEYDYLRDQFEDYLKSINDFKKKFQKKDQEDQQNVEDQKKDLLT